MVEKQTNFCLSLLTKKNNFENFEQFFVKFLKKNFSENVEYKYGI